MIIKSYLINITQTQKCVSCLKFRLLDCILILLKSLTDTTNVFSQVMCAMGKLQPNQIWQPEPENDVREVLMHQITSWPLIKKNEQSVEKHSEVSRHESKTLFTINDTVKKIIL